MNFLAHLVLAEPTPESRLGNLLGDFVKGYPWDDRYPSAVWKGIVEHRRLDVFTDTHDSWRASRARLPDRLFRLAGILIDLFYDYLLCKNWQQFFETDLEETIGQIHEDLVRGLELVEVPDESIIKEMIDEGWLMSYLDLGSLGDTLDRVSRRSSVLSPMRNSAQYLFADLEDYADDFSNFFPDARQAASKLHECSIGELKNSPDPE